MKTKICSKCKKEKTLFKFSKDGSKQDGLNTWCRMCKRKSFNQYYNKNKRKVKIKCEEYRKNHIKERRQLQLMYSYKITLADYNEMFNNQNGCCAICEKHQLELNKKLCVDHNHKTGKVRGLLCDSCNRGMGQFYESIKNLKSVIKYLRNNK